jgi:maltooligosyltrehalose trehalohydrolase
METFRQNYQPGITPNPDGKTSKALVWAPFAESVAIISDDGKQYPLNEAGNGYWNKVDVPLTTGNLYHIGLDGGNKLPDPASLAQPQGVHGPSRVVDLNTYKWKDENWKGMAVENLIIYELHVGTFSVKGDFQSIIPHLPYLNDLGINTIELMPVAQFPGHRNWGYDGVFPYAVQQSYGGPENFQNFIDVCHTHGLAVVLDVVYNHLGPEGNYLNKFAPYFTDKYKTPWGEAINFDDAWCDGVRHYFIENALMWLRDFHIDGLRLDAVHAIKDLGARHFLAELKQAVELQSNETGRHHFIIAECDLNDVRYISAYSGGGYNLDTQWCDEFHHALHAFTTHETDGYYSDFGGIGPLIKSYNDAFVYDGVYSPYSKKLFGNKTTGLPGHKFVVFAQNHDQVGNRRLGKRLSALVSFEMQKVTAAIYLLSPFNPMIFMGEEFGERNPFLYFTSHTDPIVAESVRKGRRKEFKDFMNNMETPDPQSEETFQKSILTPSEKHTKSQRQLLQWYKTLIAFRKKHAVWQTNARNNLYAEALTNHVMMVTGTTQNKTFKILYNFGNQDYRYTDNNSHEIILCSAHKEYGGKIENDASKQINQTFLVPSESIIISEIFQL